MSDGRRKGREDRAPSWHRSSLPAFLSFVLTFFRLGRLGAAPHSMPACPLPRCSHARVALLRRQAVASKAQLAAITNAGPLPLCALRDLHRGAFQLVEDMEGMPSIPDRWAGMGGSGGRPSF